MNDPVIIATLISILGTSLSAVIAWLLTRRRYESEVERNSAEAAEAVSEAALTLMNPLKTRISELTQEIVNIQSDRVCEREKYTEDIRLLNERLTRVNTLLLQREAETQELRGGIDVLIGQLKQLGIIPKYQLGP